MYLHNDHDAFVEVVHRVQNETGYELQIIEKDYYVSLMLKALSETDVDFVFKGGTSLSKAYKVINRFSEDIDLTVTQTPTQGERVHMADVVMACAEKIGLHIINRESIHRRGHFNRFVFAYQSAFVHTVVSPQIMVEVFVTLLAFPTEKIRIDSFVGNILGKYNYTALLEYELQPFEMSVQSIKRTFIDKVFALCDYYLSGQAQRYSRHVYDIYQILNKISLDNIDTQLIAAVRNERLKNAKCLSVKDDVNPTAILSAIVAEDYFRDDYNDITRKLLFEKVSYEQAITALKKIIASGVFTKNV